MKHLGSLLSMFARSLERAGLLVYRLGNAAHNLLPVVLSPRESSALLERYYKRTYYSEECLGDAGSVETLGFELEPWEVDLCHRYGLSSGRLLVLGCGWGRESIRIAERGMRVVGLDCYPAVLDIANRAAVERKLPARFVRGDFLAMPCKPGSFDAVLLSGTMYSAIPGRETRQGWLRLVRGLCKPGQPVILSFQTDTRSKGRVDRLTDRLRAALLRLPGTNPHYQDGDVCQSGHFFHLFQDETELKAEFDRAEVHIEELNWPRRYAVLRGEMA